jgi:hypothetical protein
MVTALLIVHGLVAVALLGAITHQTLAAWARGAMLRTVGNASTSTFARTRSNAATYDGRTLCALAYTPPW